MNLEAMERLGLKVRSYSEAVFVAFAGSEGRGLYEQAEHQLSRHGIDRSHVRVQVSLRPDLWNAVQFLISAPHGAVTGRRTGYMCLIYPDRMATMERGSWHEVAPGWAASHYWEHLDVLEEVAL